MSAAKREGQDPLESLIARFLEAEKSGIDFDRDAIIEEHPELADSLREFFASHDRMKSAADVDPPTLPPRSSGPASESPTIAPEASPLDDPTLPPTERGGDDPTLPPSEGASKTDEPTVGDKVRYFGDYELLEEIARGGMGVVYLARQMNLNRVVALKMILAGQFAGEEDVRRFYTEAEAAASLDHPGIVPIFEIGEHGKQHYFSMGYIEGQSLAQRVVDGPLPPREAAELVKKTCEAMAYAHQRGVIHRDLKPANILLDPSGQSKVTDFGLAKKTETDSGLTGTGQILGTPAYMPPEQASGKIDEIGPLADVYSLGAILYCLLTGRPPFQASNAMDTLLQVLDRDPVAPRTLNPQVPRDLETICLKCLRKESRSRYATVQEMDAELQRFLKGEPIHARQISAPAKAWRWCKRKPAVASLIVALVLAMVSGTLVSTAFAIYAQAKAKYATEQRYVSSLRSEVELGLSNDNTELAEAVLEMMLEDYPNEFQTRGALFSIAMHIDDDQKADAYLEQSLKRSSEDAEKYMMMGDRYMVQDRSGKADDYYRKALAVAPNNCGAAFALGRNAFNDKRYEVAISYLDKAGQLCKESALHENCLAFRVETLVALGRLDDAEADLKTLTDEYPESPGTLAALLSVVMRIGDAAKAEQYLQQAVNQSKNQAVVYATMGDRFRTEGMRADAARYYRMALQVNPAHCGSAFALGRDALTEARYEEALQYLDMACRLCDNTVVHSSALRYRTEAHLALGHLDQAEADLETLISKYPEDPDTLRTVLKVAAGKSNEKLPN